MSLLASLQWYWDLSAADASIVDQHSGLSLGKVGTATTESTGGPDGGPCISVGTEAGKYRNASVAKTASYDDGYTASIWARSTGSSAVFNLLMLHRGNPPFVAGGYYFQMAARDSTILGGANASDFVLTWSAAPAVRLAYGAMAALNVWQMVTLVDTGTSTKFYRNATLIATSSTSLGARSTEAAPFVIGGDWNPTMIAGGNHRGQLAMAGVWNEPLSQFNITKLYNGGMGRRYDDLRSSGIVPIIRQHYAAQGAR